MACDHKFVDSTRCLKCGWSPRKQGFATMTPERRREISSLGGRASHALRAGHEWDSAEAAEQGRKGGLVSAARRKGLRPKGTSE